MQRLLQSNYNHPNIIQVFHIAEKDGCHYIIMEKCLRGHLEKTISLSRKNKVPFTATEILDILKQIVNGYKFLYD
jgi:serine/threonine protein kinase